MPFPVSRNEIINEAKKLLAETKLPEILPLWYSCGVLKRLQLPRILDKESNWKSPKVTSW